MNRLTKLLTKLILIAMVVAIFPLSASAMTYSEAGTILKSLNSTNFYTGMITFIHNDGVVKIPDNQAQQLAILYGLTKFDSDSRINYGVKTTYNGTTITTLDEDWEELSATIKYDILLDDEETDYTKVANFNSDTGADFIGMFFQTYSGIVPANACNNVTENTLASDMAITDIRTSSTKADTITYNGITYYAIVNTNINTYKASQKYSLYQDAEIMETPVDLNRDAGGDNIYMYYTTDPAAGNPITDLYWYNSLSPDAPQGYTAVANVNDETQNFNSGASDSRYYLYFSRAPYSKEQYKEAYDRIYSGNSEQGAYITDVGIVTGDDLVASLENLEAASAYSDGEWRIDGTTEIGTDSSGNKYYLAIQTSDNVDSAVFNIKVYEDTDDIPWYEYEHYEIIKYYNGNESNTFTCSGGEYYIAVSHYQMDGRFKPITGVYLTTEKPVGDSAYYMTVHEETTPFFMLHNSSLDTVYVNFTRGGTVGTVATDSDVMMFVILSIVLVVAAGVAILVAHKRKVKIG